MGCMALTGIYGKVERRDAIATLHRALDLGIDHFDTAELYGPYINEELLADAFGAEISKIHISTKFGYKIDNGKIVGLDSRPSTIRTAVDGSLKRLRCERIDLLYQHRLDPRMPVEDVVGTMADLVEMGKVKAIGLSSVDADTFKRANLIHPIVAVQNEHSLLRHGFQVDLLEEIEGQRSVAVAHSPLGRGILSGGFTGRSKIPSDDYRSSNSRFQEDSHALMNDALQALWDVASERGTTPTAVALAWLLARSPNMFAIPGAKSVPQINMCVHAEDLRLTDEELDRLDAVVVASHGKPKFPAKACGPLSLPPVKD